MVRYPFQSAANRFLEAWLNVYSDAMWVELERRYRKIAANLRNLQAAGKIKTTDPGKLTAEDVKAYVIDLKSRGLKQNSIINDTSALSKLCMFHSENNCVDVAKLRYPLLFTKKSHKRLPVMERPIYDRLISLANSLTENDSMTRIRAYAATCLAVGGGLRTLELIHTKIFYLDTNARYIYLDVTKGQGTYGEPRTVPLRPEVAPILHLWCKVRSKEPNAASEYLFPNPERSTLSGNTFTKMREKVMAELMYKYDYRKLRRTYGQYLVDEGFSTDYVSVAMGHTNTVTTEANYARPRNDRVVRTIIESWKKIEKEGESEEL